NATVGAAIIAIGPLSISIGAAIVAKGYTISQLALESIELGCLEKGGFVAKLLMLLV
ncbi:32389_t:CDS:1, partial [Gigaspora margarita]